MGDDVPSEAELRAHLAGLMLKDMLRRGYKVQAKARRFLSGEAGHPRRIATGDLRSSVQVQPTTYGGEPAVRIGTNKKTAKWVHDGTGIYGPRHRKITPTVKRALAFKINGRTIVVRSVKGMRPNRFLKDALPAARD